jgi:ketosteroid isomerase-like protein
MPAAAETSGVRSVVCVRERAGRRRTLEDRLFLRFPSIGRLLTRAFSRLPPGSRVRRALLARRIGLAYAAANRRDFEVVLAGMDLGVYEYRPSRDLLPPDVEDVFYGQEGYLRLWRYWSDAFDDIRWDPHEVLDLGDQFLVTTEQCGHGSGSGIAVSKPVYQLLTVRDGLVIRQEDFLDRGVAIAAAMRED